MRFKAKMQQQELSLLSGVVTAVEKLGSSGHIHLSENTIRLAVNAHGAGEVQVFCELPQEAIFSEHRIESQAGNCIFFEIGLENFMRALISCKNSPWCQLKLVKRNGKPCICVETRALEVALVHDIPVKILKASDVQYHVPPELPVPEVQLELPTTRSIRTVIDRMKGLDKHVYIHGDMSGSLTFRVENDRVTLKTFYKHMAPKFDSLNEEEARHNKAEILVDVKKLSNVLHFYGSPFESAMFCFCEESCLVVHVTMDSAVGAYMTYYIPTLSIGDDCIM